MFHGVIRISKTEVLSPDFERLLLLCGGVALMGCAENVELETWLKILPSVCRALPLTKDSRFVVVAEDLVATLTQDEYTALMAHEEGHYKLGHLNGASGGLVDNMEFEHAADDYAVSVVKSTWIVADTLRKLLNYCKTVVLPTLFKLMGVDATEVINEMVVFASVRMAIEFEPRFKHLGCTV